MNEANKARELLNENEWMNVFHSNIHPKLLGIV